MVQRFLSKKMQCFWSSTLVLPVWHLSGVGSESRSFSVSRSGYDAGACKVQVYVQMEGFYASLGVELAIC